MQENIFMSVVFRTWNGQVYYWNPESDKADKFVNQDDSSPFPCCESDWEDADEYAQEHGYLGETTWEEFVEGIEEEA